MSEFAGDMVVHKKYWHKLALNSSECKNVIRFMQPTNLSSSVSNVLEERPTDASLMIKSEIKNDFV